jgi:pantothenate synthetase
MKKSLVAAKPIEPSKELERFLGEPPLIGNERLEDYLAFSSRIERAAKPADDIARLLVRDLVNIWWEIRRERLIKVEIIKQKQREAVATVGLTRADYVRMSRAAERMSMPRDEDDEPSMFRKRVLSR